MLDEKNFNEYESHLDSLINQYKSQLENIKNNRQNKSILNGRNIHSDLSTITVDNKSSKSNILSNSPSKTSIHSNQKKSSQNLLEDRIINLNNNNKPQINQSQISMTSNLTNFNQKMSTLTEENLKLNRKITELSKQVENKEELLIKCERLQSELNKSANSEVILKQEKQELELKINELENKIHKLNNRETVFDQDMERMNEKIKDVEKYFEELMRNKDEEVEYLNKKVNDCNGENNKRIIVIQKLNSFLKKTMKHMHDKSLQYTYEENMKISDYENCFNLIEQFIGKIMQDNSDLVRHLNKVISRNEAEEESVKVKKLNLTIDDLRVENSLLKSQLSNLIDNNKKTINNSSHKSTLSHNNSNKKVLISPPESETERKEKKKKKQHQKKKKVEDTSGYNSEVSEYEKSNRSYVSNLDSKRKRPIFSPLPSAKLVKENYIANPISPSNDAVNMLSPSNQQFNFVKNQINNVENESKGRDQESGHEIFQLEKLKNKIKELESKIGEINKDEKEKQIIDSLREYRNRNISPHSKREIK